jgi:hypothetical protein
MNKMIILLQVKGFLKYGLYDYCIGSAAANQSITNQCQEHSKKLSRSKITVIKKGQQRLEDCIRCLNE